MKGKYKNKRNIHRPYPEFLKIEANNKWRVEECVGELANVDLVNKIMRVPFGGAPVDRFSRMHEMCHTAFSDKLPPASVDMLEAQLFQLVENLWINNFLFSVVFKEEFNKELPLPNINPYYSINDKIFTLLNYSPYGKRFSLWADREAEKYKLEEIYKKCKKITKHISRYTSKFNRIKAAKALYDLLNTSCLIDDEISDEGEDDVLFNNKEIIITNDGTDTIWAPMEIVNNLTESGKSFGRFLAKKGFSDRGVVPEAVYRYLVDGNIFRRKLLNKTGTILLDMSGSMSFELAAMQQFVKTRPNITVAGYSGGEGEKKGWLQILVKDGKIAPRIDHMGQLNLVDLPALMWLAKQNKPRVWVSDGCATKMCVRTGGDVGNESTRTECSKFAANNHITRVEAVKFINRLFIKRG